MANQALWKQETSKMFYGVLLFTLLGSIASIVDLFSMMRSLGSLMSGESSTPWGSYIVRALILAGYALFFVGLNGWLKQLTNQEQVLVKKIKIAVILNLVAVVCFFIPVAGKYITAIINIVAWVLYLQAYSGLRDSATFPELARKGAKSLRTATILGIVAAIIGIIPIIKFITFIFDITVMIMLIIGWNNIKNAQVAQEQ